MGNLDGIVIPSAGFVGEDLERFKFAVDYNLENYDGKLPYIIAGAGPDLEEYLIQNNIFVDVPCEFIRSDKDACPKRGLELDVHEVLFSEVLEEVRRHGTSFKVDTGSTTRVMSMINIFSKIESGDYGFVAREGHLWKIKFLEKALKSKGILSKGLEFEYIPTRGFFQQTVKEQAHDLISLGVYSFRDLPIINNYLGSTS